MPISETDLENALKKKFPAAKIACRDLAGDQDHWEVSIVDPVFDGQSRIEQHKMVQAAVSDHDIHALSIKTAVK